MKNGQMRKKMRKKMKNGQIRKKMRKKMTQTLTDDNLKTEKLRKKKHKHKQREKILVTFAT
jgi:hypothetical protein